MTTHDEKQPIAPFTMAHGDHFELRPILLYFIHLSFHGLENLLFAYLQSSNKKTMANRRKAVGKAVDKFCKKEKRYNDYDEKLGWRDHILYDFATKPSTEILRALEDGEKNKLFTF